MNDRRLRGCAAVLVAAATALSSCGGSDKSVTAVRSRASDPASTEAAPTAPTTSTVPTGLIVDGEVDIAALKSKIDALLELPPAQQEVQLATLDGQLERQLWVVSGLEAELGGAAAADAAFAEHSQAIVASARASGDQPLVKSGFRQTSAPSGPNIGEGLFGGYMIIALGAGLVSTTNDLKDGESGTRSDEAKTTTATAALDKVQLDTVTTHDGEGVTTTLKTKMTINPCPDAKGQFEAKATIDVSTTKSGGSTGQKGTLDVTINWQVDDDAKLASSEADYRMQWADFSGGKGSFVEVAGAFGDTKITGATLTRSGGAASVKLLESAAVTASLYTVMAKYWIVQEAEKGWQSGRCVVLTPTAAPGSKGMKPGSNSSIAAAPRSRIDSTPVGGSVTATLSAGGASVDPAGSKVPADATFTYTAPGEVDQSGTVSLEARSKRGVAKADITFDTSGSYSYSITGGLQDFQVVGQVVCDVRGPFALESPGVATATFSGGESLSGTYTATGVFGLSYAGTYSISLPDGPGKPGTMSGSSSGETAGQAGSGTETYILTPVGPCT